MACPRQLAPQTDPPTFLLCLPPSLPCFLLPFFLSLSFSASSPILHSLYLFSCLGLGLELPPDYFFLLLCLVPLLPNRFLMACPRQLAPQTAPASFPSLLPPQPCLLFIYHYSYECCRFLMACPRQLAPQTDPASFLSLLLPQSCTLFIYSLA